MFLWRSRSNSSYLLFNWKILYFGRHSDSLFLHSRIISDENERHLYRHLFYYRYVVSNTSKLLIEKIIIGHVGGVLAPLLADAGKKIDPALPYIIFSIVNIIVGVLCLLLPETNHIPLPNTIQEAVEMEKYEGKKCIIGFCIFNYFL